MTDVGTMMGILRVRSGAPSLFSGWMLFGRLCSNFQQPLSLTRSSCWALQIIIWVAAMARSFWIQSWNACSNGFHSRRRVCGQTFLRIMISGTRLTTQSTATVCCTRRARQGIFVCGRISGWGEKRLSSPSCDFDFLKRTWCAPGTVRTVCSFVLYCRVKAFLNVVVLYSTLPYSILIRLWRVAELYVWIPPGCDMLTVLSYQTFVLTAAWNVQ